jgi:hypothetical protein
MQLDGLPKLLSAVVFKARAGGDRVIAVLTTSTEEKLRATAAN